MHIDHVCVYHMFIYATTSTRYVELLVTQRCSTFSSPKTILNTALNDEQVRAMATLQAARHVCRAMATLVRFYGDTSSGTTCVQSHGEGFAMHARGLTLHDLM